MDAPARKKIKASDYISKVLIELPALSASEMEQAHMLQRHLFLTVDVEIEIAALRWWYLTHLLFGMLHHRGKAPLEVSLQVLQQFITYRQPAIDALGLDFESRSEFYERALQDDLDDEGHEQHLQACFLRYCGSQSDALKELYFAAMIGLTNRLAKTMDKFEIVQD